MASYRQRQNKTWEVTIDIGRDPLTGKRLRKFKGGFKTKKEATAFANSFSVDIANGLNVIDNKILLCDFITSWYKDYKSKTLSMNTRTAYESRINNYIIPYLGQVQLGQLNTAYVQQFYNELLKQDLKPNSVKKIIEVLRGCYKYAKKLNLVNYIPTEIETVREEKTKALVWDEEQLKFCLSEIKDTWLYIPTLVASLTGLRIGELCGLRWSNVDLDKGIIYVKEQVQIDKSNKSLVHTPMLKTNASCRSISIPKTLVDLLKNHKSAQLDSNDFVILDNYTNICNPRNVSMRFSHAVTRLMKSYNHTYDKLLPKISFHGLRHTHATILLLKGENVKVISERLGHASVKITLDNYSHVLPSMRRSTANLLDNMFNDL